MSARTNKVIMIVDRNYTGDVVSLATDGHVWLIESPANRDAAENYPALNGKSTVENGLTIFKAADDDSGSETCLSMLETIDLHHGIYSSNPPYSVFEIVGAPLSRSVKTAIEALGFSRFEPTENGFRALR